MTVLAWVTAVTSLVTGRMAMVAHTKMMAIGGYGSRDRDQRSKKHLGDGRHRGRSILCWNHKVNAWRLSFGKPL